MGVGVHMHGGAQYVCIDMPVQVVAVLVFLVHAMWLDLAPNRFLTGRSSSVTPQLWERAIQRTQTFWVELKKFCPTFEHLSTCPSSLLSRCGVPSRAIDSIYKLINIFQEQLDGMRVEQSLL